MKTSTNYDILIHKIDVFIRKYYLNKVLRGALFLVAILFSGFLAIILSEYFGNFSSTIRGVMFFGYCIVSAGLFCWLVVLPLLAYLKLGQIITHDEAARIIGQHFSDVNDKLLNTLQLKRLADEYPAQQRLIEASIDQKVISLKSVSFPSAVRIKENIKNLKWVVLPLAIIIVLAFAAPAMLRESTKKIIQHDLNFAPKAPFQFEVSNKSLSVVQGEDFKLEIKLNGNHFPDNIYVETAKNAFKMNKESTSRFNYSFSNLQQNMHFRVVGNGFSSQEYEIKVNAKPSLLNLDVLLIYPAYLKKRNEQINNAGDVTIPTGTEITWQVHTKNTNQLFFYFNGHHERVKGGDNTFRKTQQILRSGSYSFKASADKVMGGDSVAYHISVIADEPPTIGVNEKKDSISSKAIYFTGQAQDDHGFSSLVFHYAEKENDGGKAKVYDLPINADLTNNQTDFFYFWNLKDLNLKPGTQVTYYFQVADNNAVGGRQAARTEERTLHVPSEIEMNQQLNADVEAVKGKMQNAISLAAQIDEDIKKLNELLMNKADLSFDEKKRIQDLLNKRKELKQMIEDAKQQNERNAVSRKENTPLDNDLADKQSRMEKLMNDLLDPKTDDVLKMLQNLMDNKLETPASKELTKMQVDEKVLSQQLNRTLELMKQLDVHTKIQENIDRLSKLADKQQELAEQTKQTNNDKKSLLQKQEQINKDFANVKKSLGEVSEKNEALENKTDFHNPKSELQKIDEQLIKSTGDLQQEKKNDAHQVQSQAADGMQQLAQKMQKSLEQEELHDIVINGKNLKNLIRRLVESSFDQENILSRLKGTKPDDPSYPNWIQKQRYIQANMRTAQDSLVALSKRLPEIESTIINETVALNQNLEQAVRFLEDRRTFEADKNQRLSMTAMNNLALMLSETLTKMQEAMKQTPKGGGGGGHKRKTILELSEMQQKLNANMQAMRDQMRQGSQPSSKAGNSSGGQGQGGPASEQFAKMARQQAEIRQAVQQINNDENKDGHQQLGDLAGLAKQMERTEADLVNKRLNDGMISRQLLIKSRLLEANQADQEREQDSKRESTGPKKDFPPGFVKALQTYEQEKSKQMEKFKTTPLELNDYYKSKVQKYFIQLNLQ